MDSSQHWKVVTVEGHFVTLEHLINVSSHVFSKDWKVIGTYSSPLLR